MRASSTSALRVSGLSSVLRGEQRPSRERTLRVQATQAREWSARRVRGSPRAALTSCPPPECGLAPASCSAARVPASLGGCGRGGCTEHMALAQGPAEMADPGAQRPRRVQHWQPAASCWLAPAGGQWQWAWRRCLRPWPLSWLTQAGWRPFRRRVECRHDGRRRRQGQVRGSPFRLKLRQGSSKLCVCCTEF